MLRHRITRSALFGILLLGAAAAFSFEASHRDGLREFQRGNYREAARQLEAALRAAEPLGEADARFAAVMGSLARVYFFQGRYREAESLYRRALAANEKSLAPDDPDLAASLASLAEVYRFLGRTAEAEPLYRRALLIRSRIHGTEHVSVAESLHDLAEVSRVQGRHAEAERLYWRAVMIRSYLQGPSHPGLWRSLNGLAEVNKALGRGAEAEQLYQRARGIAEKALPASYWRGRLTEFAVVGDTETLATSRGNSASLQIMPGATLAERERLAAAEHPELARQLEGLAEVYRAQGQLGAALELLRRVAAMREGALGAQHPEVGQAYGAIARVLAALRQDDAALAAARIATRLLAPQEHKQRWQDVFGLHVQLLAERPGSLGESFSVMQQAASAARVLALPEAQALLEPHEALVACLASGETLHVWLVRPGTAALQAGLSGLALPRGVLSVLVAGECPARGRLGGLPVTRLPDVAALATRR